MPGKEIVKLQLPTMEWMLTGQKIAFTPIPMDGMVFYVPELHVDGHTIRPLRIEEVEDIVSALNALQAVREIARHS